MQITERQRQMLEGFTKRSAEKRAAEEAILMPPKNLASQLSQMSGDPLAQNRISSTERGKPDRAPQLIASRYFRNLGYEVDNVGDSIHIDPAKPDDEHH